jgi:hypothetical protein
MRILIYNNNEVNNEANSEVNNESVRSKIQTALKLFENCQVILSEDYSGFKKEFSLCLSGETIIVFFIKNEIDLNFLESIQRDFVDVKLIINIAEKKLYQARALKLRPRIITNADEDIQLLLGVIQGGVKEKFKNQVG